MTTNLTHVSDKMMQSERMEKSLGKLIVFMSLISSGTTKFSCPSAVELNTNMTLTCSFPNRTSIYYYPPTTQSDHVAGCLRSGRSFDTENRYSATSLNSTHCQLNIHNVMKDDGGTWLCKDVNGPTNSTCAFPVIKTPSCFIGGNRDPQNLAVNKNVSLLVNITDFYCSQDASFSLQTGGRKETLVNANQVTTTEPGMYYSVFIVTDSHRGSVGLLFTCNNVTTKVRCGGVTSLGLAHTVKSDDEIGIRFVEIAIPVSAAFLVIINIVIPVVMRVRPKASKGNSNNEMHIYAEPCSNGTVPPSVNNKANVIYCEPWV